MPVYWDEWTSNGTNGRPMGPMDNPGIQKFYSNTLSNSDVQYATINEQWALLLSFTKLKECIIYYYLLIYRETNSYKSMYWTCKYNVSVEIKSGNKLASQHCSSKFIESKVSANLEIAFCQYMDQMQFLNLLTLLTL